MAMDEEKKKRLEEKGWKVGTVEEFLDLTKEEVDKIDRSIERDGDGAQRQID